MFSGKSTLAVDESNKDSTCKEPGGVEETTVTVGIPVFNGEKTIGQSIDSILAQTHRNLRVAISDNDSSDGTREICLAKAANDARISYFRQEQNIGVFANYNATFLKCDSKYFKWQSSSDWCQPEFIKACVDVLEANDDVVLGCPEVLLVRDSGSAKPYPDDFGLMMDDPADRFRSLLQCIKLSNMFNGVIRTDALQKSILNRNFEGSDIALLADLALKGKFVLIPEKLWYRRMTAETASIMKSGHDRDQFFAGLPSNYESRIAWKMIGSLLHVVMRSDIGAVAKMKCLSYLLKMIRWRRKELWRELFRRQP